MDDPIGASGVPLERSAPAQTGLRPSPGTPQWEGLTPPYATIVADPPWHYDEVNPPNPWMNVAESRRKGYGGGDLPYGSMSLDDIKALPVGELAVDGRCFLWVTNRYLFDGPDVLRAWGFEPQAKVLVWCKTPRGTMNVTTEYVLIGKRGKPPKMPWTNTTWYQWPLQIGRGHSAKPAAFGDLVEQWCPGPYLELFCRAPRLGWDHWGHGYEIGASA